MKNKIILATFLFAISVFSAKAQVHEPIQIPDGIKGIGESKEDIIINTNLQLEGTISGNQNDALRITMVAFYL